jgi:lipoprotein-anchoring transpeptidase ErfK/SrfK
MLLTRRAFLAGVPLAAAGCATYQAPVARGPQFDPAYLAMYAAVPGEPFPVPAVDLTQIDPRYFRQEVAYPGNQPAGTIIVDPNARFLYLVLEGGRALRYGVGVGRTEAFNFVGEAVIERKAAWPTWTPTQDMIAREPERYGPYAGGLPGGLDNPLGARALYLYENGRDTLYRLHGTNEPWSIGKKVSSGCVRLLNQDIIDLYGRVPLGSRVFVLPSAGYYPA